MNIFSPPASILIFEHQLTNICLTRWLGVQGPGSGCICSSSDTASLLHQLRLSIHNTPAAEIAQPPAK